MPSTLRRKQLLILKTDHLQSETGHVKVDHLRASKMHRQKMPYHVNHLNNLQRLTKSNLTIKKKAL